MIGVLFRFSSIWNYSHTHDTSVEHKEDQLDGRSKNCCLDKEAKTSFKSREMR